MITVAEPVARLVSRAARDASFDGAARRAADNYRPVAAAMRYKAGLISIQIDRQGV